MSFWLSDDKDWVKKRRDEWKHVKYSLDQIVSIRKDLIKYLKQYYLTGVDDKQWPINRFKEAVLLELWFCPDHSLSNWEHIKNKYEDWQWYNAQQVFREIAASNHYKYSGESFFSGLEEELYKFLMPQRFTQELFPLYKGQEFIETAYDYYRGLAASFKTYLCEKKPNPYNITRFYVPLWQDALKIGFRERIEFDWLIEKVDQVLLYPENCHVVQVLLANQILTVLNDKSLPQEIKEKIVDVRYRLSNPQAPRECPWKAKDKEWMKQRRKQWELIEDTFKCISEVNEKNIKILKRFFMTGKVSEPNTLNATIVKGGLLFELWFDPGQDEQYFATTKEKYSESQVADALEMYKKYSSENIFNDADERLRRYLS